MIPVGAPSQARTNRRQGIRAISQGVMVHIPLRKAFQLICCAVHLKGIGASNAMNLPRNYPVKLRSKDAYLRKLLLSSDSRLIGWSRKTRGRNIQHHCTLTVPGGAVPPIALAALALK